jgi:hypothetical protein
VTGLFSESLSNNRPGDPHPAATQTKWVPRSGPSDLGLLSNRLTIRYRPATSRKRNFLQRVAHERVRLILDTPLFSSME